MRKKLLALGVFALTVNVLLAQTDNHLSKKEQKQGWQLLFDGKTTRGWHSYLKQSAGLAWGSSNGLLQLDASVKDGQGDLLTNKEYQNFELAIDWKIAEEGNSGIIFLVHEDTSYHNTYETGPEYQLLDDKKADDNKKANHLAGSLYDMVAPVKPIENPAGKWNHSIIRLQSGGLTFWLNGVQIVKTQLWDANWSKLVASSKFKDWKGFAAFHKGHIALQDHGYHIAFRNVKIREL